MQKTTTDYLKKYEIYVEYWEDEAGDTHELLGCREILHQRLNQMTSTQLAQLSAVDEQVLRLVQQHPTTQSWDVAMLRQTAALVQDERQHPTTTHT